MENKNFSANKARFDFHEERDALDALYNNYELALLYEQGHGTEIDLVQAFELMYKVAQNNEMRKKSVGGYKNGAFWHDFKTVKGVPEAKYRLAYYYENGIGTEVDLEKALEWYSLALESGYDDAEKDVERLKKL